MSVRLSPEQERSADQEHRQRRNGDALKRSLKTGELLDEHGDDIHLLDEPGVSEDQRRRSMEHAMKLVKKFGVRPDVVRRAYGLA